MPHNGTDLNRLEAVLFASEHAVPLLVLRQVLGDHSTRQRVIDALQALQQRYAQTALELVETASGYRMQVRAVHGGLNGP
jgi:chromosome segregation and condensation protein ScpB